MQYEEAKTVFESEDALKRVLIETGKPVSEIVKTILRTPRNEIELWNHTHTEAGTLVKLERKDVTYGYQVLATYQSQKASKYNDGERTDRSIFFNDNGKMYDKWEQLLNKRCLFFIGYTENEDDGSVFRNLLDIEEL